jgi:hypothetical protein
MEVGVRFANPTYSSRLSRGETPRLAHRVLKVGQDTPPIDTAMTYLPPARPVMGARCTFEHREKTGNGTVPFVSEIQKKTP